MTEAEKTPLPTEPAAQRPPRKPREPILPALVGLAVLLGAAAFIGWGLWKAMTPPAPPLQGMMDARTIAVAAKIPGRIAAIRVKEGDAVEAGDAVAQIAIPEIEAKLAQAQALKQAAESRASLADEGPRRQQIDAAKADLARARAGLALADASWRRVKSLFDDGFVPAQKLDEAAAAKRSAEELVRAAEAQLSALEEGARPQEKDAAQALARQAAGGVAEAASLAGEGDVRSPVSGEVSRIVMHEGEVAPAGFPLVLVTQLSEQWAVFNLREDELPGVEVGTEFTAELPALGRSARFRVYWISPRGDYAVWRATRQSSGYDLKTFEVRARPVEAVRGLRPGMTVVLERSALPGKAAAAAGASGSSAAASPASAGR